MPANPFAIPIRPTAGLLGVASTAALTIASHLLGLDACRTIYRHLEAPSRESFASRVLQALRIVPDCPRSDLRRVPSSGPLIVAANHPCGALDGLVLLALVQRLRPDVRLLANHLLARVPELAAVCFFADPFGGASASANSLAGLRAARRWVSGGGTLIAFPSGEVAHERKSEGSYADSPWSATVGRMAVATGAQVVPAFIAGANRRRFYAAGRVHPMLRTALLPRELLAKRGQRIAISIGAAVAVDELVRSGLGGAVVTQRIREKVDELGVRHRQARRCADEDGTVD